MSGGCSVNWTTPTISGDLTSTGEVWLADLGLAEKVRRAGVVEPCRSESGGC